MYRTFHGKVLLFGEYTVISGSKALVMPLEKFTASLELPLGQTLTEPGLKRSNRNLGELMEYLEGIREKGELLCDLNARQLRQEIEMGLYFRSSIPEQYGAGSSAALVAAVYDAFCIDKIDPFTADSNSLNQLKNIFSRMESKFHESSSGIDPLCSFTGKTILVDGEEIAPVSLPGLDGGRMIFLVDSGIKGETAPLVNHFKEKLSGDLEFSRLIHSDLSILAGECIMALCEGAMQDFSDNFSKISAFQLRHFEDMIPSSIRNSWKEGLNTGSYMLKLCGSGGGGFFLGYAEDWETARKNFTKKRMTIFPLEI